MILNDEEIQENSNVLNLISPFNTELLNAHSYDFRLDNKFQIPVKAEKGKWELREREELIIGPYEFILGSTVESIILPRNIVGFVQGKSTIGRNGLQIENAGLLDAGFDGTITLELFNMSPWFLTLKAGMRICQVHFTLTKRSKKRHYDKIGNYNGQKGPTLPKYKI